MKCFTINMSWLKEFNIWSADFFSLLDKQEYEEILKLSDNEIMEKVKKLELSNKDVELIDRTIRQNFRHFCFSFNLFTNVRPNIYNFWNQTEMTPKEEEKLKIHLNKKARIKKTDANLKHKYVLLLYALKLSNKIMILKQNKLKEDLEHNKELLKKIELQGGKNKNGAKS